MPDRPLTVALIAHDNMKKALADWAKKHRQLLTSCQLVATGTTGKMLKQKAKLNVRSMKSGPLGGDLQIGAMVANDEIDALIFLWDPLSPHPHDVDVKALLRVAVLNNVPMACNLATANALLMAMERV